MAAAVDFMHVYTAMNNSGSFFSLSIGHFSFRNMENLCLKFKIGAIEHRQEVFGIYIRNACGKPTAQKVLETLVKESVLTSIKGVGFS